MSAYTDRIPPENAKKPKFVALVDDTTGNFAGIQDLETNLIQYFDLDTAVGVQLDTIGEWVGIGREVSVPIAGVYFSFDISGIGFDQGVWKGPFDPDTGITSLPDDIYRVLIRAKIGANRWDGSMAGWKAIVDQVFPPETRIAVQDNGDMTITVIIAGTLPSALQIALIENGYLPLKPEAIGVRYTMTSVDGTPGFGFDVNNSYIAGFDTGAWTI